MEVLEAIHARRSVRSFRDADVPDETLETLLRAAMAAPTAGNQQPWRFVVVRDAETRARLGAAGVYKTPAANAPVDIVVLGEPGSGPLDGHWWALDCALAVENLMIAAVPLGLGTVWLAGWPNAEWAGNYAEAIGAPDGVVPLAVIAVGVPEKVPAPQDRYRPDHVFSERYGEVLTAATTG